MLTGMVTGSDGLVVGYCAEKLVVVPSRERERDVDGRDPDRGLALVVAVKYIGIGFGGKTTVVGCGCLVGRLSLGSRFRLEVESVEFVLFDRLFISGEK